MEENITRVPTVGIVVLDGEKSLLVKHGVSAGHPTGTYGTSGGRVDSGETDVEAAIRELKEETGLDVLAEDLVELPNKYLVSLDRKNGEKLHVSHTVFVTDKYSGELLGSDEAVPEWVEDSRLDELDLLPNIQDMVARARVYIEK